MTDPNNNGYTPNGSNPYGQASNSGQNYGQTGNGANSYGSQQPGYGQPAGSPYTQSNPYGQTNGTSSNPYGQSQPAGNPYGQPAGSSNPYAQPVQPSSNPYGQTTNSNPYAQQPGQPAAGYGQQPPVAPAAPAAQYSGQASYSTAGEPPLWAPWYGISFPNAIVRFFKKYAVFHGRASRSEYWWWFLFTVIISSVFSVLNTATDGSSIISGLEGIWNLAILVPGIALAIRRLHDTNRSGWWVLLPYGLAVVGLIVIFIGGGAAILTATGNGGVGGSVGSVGLFIVGLLLCLAGGIASIVLYVGQSDPQGARFDQPNA
ncbi:hypothetical protein EP30_00095 [Bifidobacterium sp. UTCIF-39]|uniref:DUF805 domain-containing protein n=1 Tax=Bifidobacterium sp. UTCIF-39 TaxID=1465359 RepID=UPI0015E48AA5|nr:DUF805 domain-containing protein [Bifidobacterium sp. UTCIF-39]TPF97786.1 hypothetical protein EP30_00095 [Bifidobacterium sp. UTCIF-39]